MIKVNKVLFVEYKFCTLVICIVVHQLFCKSYVSYLFTFFFFSTTLDQIIINLNLLVWIIFFFFFRPKIIYPNEIFENIERLCDRRREVNKRFFLDCWEYFFSLYFLKLVVLIFPIMNRQYPIIKGNFQPRTIRTIVTFGK